jgi:hypothetical protein
MQTVVELPGFLRAANAAGMSDEERERVVYTVAKSPEVGTSLGVGLFKMRVARPGQGKRGGYRIIYFFVGTDMPIFLLTCFAKNQKDNISPAQLSALHTLCEQLRGHYRKLT